MNPFDKRTRIDRNAKIGDLYYMIEDGINVFEVTAAWETEMFSGGYATAYSMKSIINSYTLEFDSTQIDHQYYNLYCIDMKSKRGLKEMFYDIFSNKDFR